MIRVITTRGEYNVDADGITGSGDTAVLTRGGETVAEVSRPHLVALIREDGEPGQAAGALVMAMDGIDTIARICVDAISDDDSPLARIYRTTVVTRDAVREVTA